MTRKWHVSLCIFGLALLFVLAGCGSDPVDENDPEQNQPNQGESCEDDTDCSADNPYCIGERCFPDPPVDCEDNADCTIEMPYCVSGTCFDQCVTSEHCSEATPICDDGTCVEDPETADICHSHDDCVGDRYCHEETCVGSDHICLLKNCGGRRGVCDPAAGVDGECVNAETCHSQLECVEDYTCLNTECVPEEEACAECEEGHECDADPTSTEVECYDPDVVCEAGLRECDGDTLVVCSDDGTTMQNIPCNMGCNEEELRCELSDGQACQQPFEVENGDSFFIDWNDYTNDYDPGVETGCVTAEHDLRTTGADITFALDLAPGEVGVVELISVVDYAALYILDDCESGASISCRAPDGHQGEHIGNDHVRSIWYENSGSEEETIYVVADTGVGAVEWTADIDITISEQVCTPDEPVCSDGELGACTTYGTHFVTDPDRECTLGCVSEDPTDGLCEAMDHSSCDSADTYAGEGTETFEGQLIDFHTDDSLEPDSVCVDYTIGSDQAEIFDGPTAYYSVDLDEGERLNAVLASQFEAGLWLTSECGESGQCLNAQNQSDDTESLRYVAGSGGETVVLVVQAVDDDLSAGEFSLELSVDEPLCDAFEPGHILGCIDDDYIHYCDNDDYPERYDCGGPCTDGECDEPSGSQCFDTIALTDGESYEGSFADATSDLLPVECGGDGAFDNPVGPDTIFEFELTEASQLVDIDLDTNSSNAGVYLLDDCPVATQNVADECIASAIPDREATFFIEDPGTYFLVVDSANRHDAADFTLTVDINFGECVPDSVRCHDGDVQRCMDAEGDETIKFRTDQACIVDCDDAEIQCTAPEEANNECGSSSSFFVDQSGQIIDNFERFNFLEPILGGECFSADSSGPDAFYEFDLDEKQGVSVDATVDVDDSGSQELGIYISDECVGATDSCDHSVEFEGSGVLEETIEFYSAQGGTFTLGLYGISDFDSGEFILDFEFFDGDCDPAKDNTCDGDTAEQCTELGDLVEIECEFGCGDGECLEKQGDFCPRPFVIDEGADAETTDLITFSHQDNIGEYTDAYNPYDEGIENNCSEIQGAGPDVVFSFQGWAGDEVELELDTEFDGALWVTTDCEAPTEHCLAGADDVFGPGVEELSFTVDRQADYYVIVDAVQTGATGEFDFDATIDPGPRLTDPLLNVDDEPLGWTLEIEDSASTELDIGNDGETQLEFDIDDGDADWLDTDPESGTVDGESSTSVEVTATCPDEAGSLSTTLVISTNEPGNGTATIEAELECFETGALDVTVDGLPEEAEHTIEVFDDESASVGVLDQDGFLGDLVPGAYDIRPEDVTHDGVTYQAASIEDVSISSGETVERTVEYAPEPGALDVTVDGLPEEAEHTIEVFDDESVSVGFLDQDGFLGDLAPGSYDVVPEDVTHDGTTYEADSVGVSVDSGDTVDLTIEYAPEPGALDVTVDGLPEEAEHTIEVFDDESDSAGFLDQDGFLGDLAPGLYDLVPENITHDDITYEAAPKNDVDVESGEPTEVTIEYAPEPGSLDVTVEGLPEEAEHTIEVVDDESASVGFLDQDGFLGDLAPGLYDLVAENVTHDGLVYAADPVEDVDVESGAATTETVQYSALPNLSTSDDELSLQAVDGEDDTAAFDIQNDGDETLEFSIDDGDAEWLTVDPESGTVDGGDSTEITVTASCSESAGSEETLHISSNGAPDDSATVSIDFDCQTTGTIDATFTGVPEDFDREDLVVEVYIASTSDQVGELDADGQLDDVEPGSYDLEPLNFEHDGTEYFAEPVVGVEVEAGQAATPTIEYEEWEE